MAQAHPIDLSEIQRELRRLKIYGAIVTTLLVVLFAVSLRWATSRPELTLERINVVDANGVLRLVIANSTRFPLPRLNGKEYARAVEPAGLVFYDAKGSELGGIAITDTEKVGRVSALAFDYPNYDAVGLLTRVSPDGKSAISGLQINSRPPADLDIVAASKLVQRRVALHNENENAEVLLADPQGKTRIRLRVDASGEASIEVLDRNGTVAFHAP